MTKKLCRIDIILHGVSNFVSSFLSSYLKHLPTLSVNRKMLDIGNKIGLSNSTMRMIERRDATDAYLVFGGMIITLLVLYFLYFW